MIYEVLQTEKAYRTQIKNTYIIVFKDYAKPTKIQVAQMLKQAGFTALNVNKVISPSKSKTKGGRRTQVRVRRPVKYYVTLKAGETLIQETPADTAVDQSTN
jgi:hypothetical protein